MKYTGLVCLTQLRSQDFRSSGFLASVRDEPSATKDNIKEPCRQLVKISPQSSLSAQRSGPFHTLPLLLTTREQFLADHCRQSFMRPSSRRSSKLMDCARRERPDPSVLRRQPARSFQHQQGDIVSQCRRSRANYYRVSQSSKKLKRSEEERLGLLHQKI
jgi:hypothetical protein